MPPKSQIRKSLDWYAAWRCLCGHLQYANQQPGDDCQFCPCTNHVGRDQVSPEESHDCDTRFETHGVSGYEL